MFWPSRRAALAAAALAIVAAASQSAAQGFRPPQSEFDPETLRIDEQEVLGEKIDHGLTFVDHEGREFSMADFRGTPLILILSYYTCDGACPAFNMELKGAIEKVNERGRVSIGEDFNVLTVSFDKNDGPEAGRMFREMIKLTGKYGDSWRVATVRDEGMIEALASSLDYRYFWSPADRMFFHPNAFFFISPEGRVVRVLHNALSDPKDMELAVIDTKFNRLKPSEVINLVVGLCYSYNFKEGKYGLNYPLFIAFGSLFTGISAFAAAAYVQRNKVKGKERLS
ncbi:MAG: SCO family protein [Candidatus Nitrospinota bacterium M3_3B_026]